MQMHQSKASAIGGEEMQCNLSLQLYDYPALKVQEIMSSANDDDNDAHAPGIMTCGALCLRSFNPCLFTEASVSLFFAACAKGRNYVK